MQPKRQSEGTSAPQKPMLGQAIACGLALGIVGLGAWSLLGQEAPYHPQTYDGAATRGFSDLNGLGEND